MGFFEEIRHRQKASVGGLAIVTKDEETCLRNLREILKGKLVVWSSASGFRYLDEAHRFSAFPEQPENVFSWLLAEMRSPREGQFTYVFSDAGDELQLGKRAFLEASRDARRVGNFLILIARTNDLPEELNEVTVLNHPLPTAQETRELLGTSPAATSALIGLTLSQQYDAMAMASTSESAMVDALIAYKEKELEKLGYLSVKKPEKTYESLRGHDAFKAWATGRKACFTTEAQEQGIRMPKGVLLAGPPGTGKSRMAEAMAHDWKVPLLVLDVGALYSKWHGGTEERVKTALEIVDRMSPCILLIDEVERTLGKGGENDAGVTERLKGAFLTWLASKKTPAFVFATANYPQRLEAAMIRKGRFDEIFALDYPEPLEREAVFKLYLSNAKLDFKKLADNTQDWSQAEIEAASQAVKAEAFAKNSEITTASVLQEISNTAPLAHSMKDEVKEMRAWAETHARKA